MTVSRIARLPFALALAAALSATPALAQGKGHKPHHERKTEVRAPKAQKRPHLERRVQPREQRRNDDYRLERNRRVPPGWCQGVGNPHNTPENCGYGRSYGILGRLPQMGSYQSNEQAYSAFRRQLDARCRMLEAQHPLDPSWQLRVRADCARQDRAWREKYGRR